MLGFGSTPLQKPRGGSVGEQFEGLQPALVFGGEIRRKRQTGKTLLDNDRHSFDSSVVPRDTPVGPCGIAAECHEVAPDLISQIGELPGMGKLVLIHRIDRGVADQDSPGCMPRLEQTKVPITGGHTVCELDLEISLRVRDQALPPVRRER